MASIIAPNFEVVTDKIVSAWKGGATPPQLPEVSKI
jgi:hypothetical protein